MSSLSSASAKALIIGISFLSPTFLSTSVTVKWKDEHMRNSKRGGAFVKLYSPESKNQCLCESLLTEGIFLTLQCARKAKML